MTAPQNPFRRAEQVEPKVKALVYGPPGAGKTWLALTAPGRVAVIDTEAGTAFYADQVEPNGPLSPFDVLPTKTFAEVEGAVAFLRTNPGTYETFVIDPVTVLYETLQDAALRYRTTKVEARARQRQEAFDPDNVDIEQLDWQRIKRAYKRLMTDLVNLPMHVIVIAREADLTEERMENGRKQRVKIGAKPDSEKSTPYYFDVTVRLVPGQRDGRDAIIEKDRTHTLELGSRIHNATFDTLFGKAIAAGGSGLRQLQSDDDAANADAASLTAGTAEAALLQPDGSWAGKAVAGNAPADFELRVAKDGPAIAFRLTAGRKAMKTAATGTLAEQIAEQRALIEGTDVVCHGTTSDETFTPAGGRPITYSVLTLTRIAGEGWAIPDDAPLPDAAGTSSHAAPTATPSEPLSADAEAELDALPMFAADGRG
jgi:AAA domain